MSSQSSSILLLLLVILLMFFGTMYVVGGLPIQSNQVPQEIQDAFPTGTFETGGGLQQFNITPFPTYAENAPTTCKMITNDIMLLVDSSGSMRGNKLVEAKLAAKIFVQLVAINPENRIGLVVFNTKSTVMSPLTNDYALLNAQIDQISENSNTCMQCGVEEAHAQFKSALRNDVKRSIVLLSDGKANYVDGRKSNNAKQPALDESKKSFAEDQISFYTIAFGRDADSRFMEQLAVETQGLAYASATEYDLTKSFTQAANDICTEAGASSR